MKKLFVFVMLTACLLVSNGWAESKKNHKHKKHNHAHRIFLLQNDVHKVENQIWIFYKDNFYIASRIYFKGNMPYTYRSKIRKVKMGPYFKVRKKVIEMPRAPLHFEYPVNYQNFSDEPLPLPQWK